MFSFDLRGAVLSEQTASQAPSQNVHGQWYVGDRYFADEADAAKWRKIEQERAADRAQLLARVAARRELLKHTANMKAVQKTIRSLDAWCLMVQGRLELEARLFDLTRAQLASPTDAGE